MKNKFLFSVFVYFIILTLISLGFWQIYRLNWKLELIEQIENSLKNDPVELSNIEKKNYLRIKTSGEIDFENQIYLYNLNDAGKPGFEAAAWYWHFVDVVWLFLFAAIYIWGS